MFSDLYVDSNIRRYKRYRGLGITHFENALQHKRRQQLHPTYSLVKSTTTSAKVAAPAISAREEIAATEKALFLLPADGTTEFL